MNLFTRDELKTLLADHPSPCVSLFMGSTPGGRSEADPIRWRKHLTEAEDRLVKAGWRSTEIKELLSPGRRLLEDSVFWRNQANGLAAFLAPEFQRLYRLPLTFEDRVVVANRFAITPLLPLLNGNGRFFVLALSQKAVRLLECTRDSASEVDLRGVPHNLAEALLTHEAREPFTSRGRRAGEGPGSWEGIFHGHGVGIDDAKDELLDYFQKIAQGLHPLLREEKAPLVLAAVDYLQPIYRTANTYPQLLEAGIDGNPDRSSNKDLQARAWQLVQPRFEAVQERAAARYRQAAGTGYTREFLEDVVAEAWAGRIETLFVPRGRQVWGVFDPATSCTVRHEEARPGDVDLLDLAAAGTLKHGRTVYAVAPEQVPSGTDVAAIACLPLAKHV
jgi:hypothetical protein